MFNTTVVPSDQNKKQINERIFFNYLVFQFLQYKVYTYSSKINVLCTVHPTWDPSRTVVTVLIELQ